MKSVIEDPSTIYINSYKSTQCNGYYERNTGCLIKIVILY